MGQRLLPGTLIAKPQQAQCNYYNTAFWPLTDECMCDATYDGERERGEGVGSSTKHMHNHRVTLAVLLTILCPHVLTRRPLAIGYHSHGESLEELEDGSLSIARLLDEVCCVVGALWRLNVSVCERQGVRKTWVVGLSLNPPPRNINICEFNSFSYYITTADTKQQTTQTSHPP